MSGKMDACVSGEIMLVHRWFVSQILKENVRLSANVAKIFTF